MPLVAGATLVPNTGATSLFGEELADFLESRDVTCLCCVPTLLASIERELPKLRILLIGGEACPPALVKRWSRPGRTLLNSYGPTETTVTATLGVMTPDRPVTIGKPLPTYSIVILDAKEDVALELGEAGEIGIAGIGVAEGYLNRPELTRAKFIDDFLALPNNPSGRIYRTGDLGRITDDGEIEYLGRIDTQIKLRGYRIELTEIESVLLEIPEIAQVVATTFEPEPGAPELVAYYSVKHGARAPDRAAIVSLMRARLPSYMTPAYLEQLPFIPTLVSNKADRKAAARAEVRAPALRRRPCPAGDGDRAGAVRGAGRRPRSRRGVDRRGFLRRIRRPLASDGALLRPGSPARAVDAGRHARRLRPYDGSPARPRARRRKAGRDGRPRGSAAPIGPSNLAYYGCGAAQTAFYAIVGALAVVACLAAFDWIYEAADSPLDALRAGARRRRRLVLRPQRPRRRGEMAAGRPGPRERRFRCGASPTSASGRRSSSCARRPPTSSPERRCSTPICACSAPGSAATRSSSRASCRSRPIFSRSARTRSSCAARSLPGYVAAGNRIHTGEIRIGRNAYVGEQSVLDIRSAIGDFGQLGHASSLQSGQRVPEGKRYAGSPAEETTTSFRLADEATVSPVRRWLFTAMRLAFVIAVAGALTDAVVVYAMAVLTGGDDALALGPWDATVTLLPMAAGAALAVTLVSLIGGLRHRLRRSAARQRLPGRGPGLSALRLPSRDAADRADVQQLAVLQPDVRRQRVHRALSALGRLEARPRRSDGLELRQRAGPGQSVPVLGRRQHGRLRQPVARQPHDVEPRVQARRLPHRRAQLPRHHGLCAARRAHRRQRSARHQGDGADRRAGARERRPARLAGLRDPARRLARPRHAGRDRPGGAGAPARAQDLAERRLDRRAARLALAHRLSSASTSSAGRRPCTA